MLRSVILGAVILVYSVGFVYAQSSIDIQGRYWITELDANGRVSDGSVTGTEVSFKDDLGVSDEDLPEVRLLWNINKSHTLRFAYTQVGLEGEKDISKDILFKGKTYTASSRVETDIDIQYLRFGWIWNFFVNEFESAKAGLLVEAKAFLIDVDLDSSSLGFSESEEFLSGLPSLGLVFQVTGDENVSLFGEVSGIAVGSYGYFFDAEIGAQVEPIDNLYLTAGYRILQIEGEDDNNYAKFKLDGPFVEAKYRF